MAAQSLSPWIADLIQEEINAVLTWQTNEDYHIKAEGGPDEVKRFSNDGSNFRSIVSQTEPGRSEVQLIEVLGPPDATGVKVVVSDGHTQIKARLVSSVVDILEAELDGKLGRETTNDVFRLKRFIVVSTYVGSEDEWIQLTIEDIEYLYHRRRNLGQPTPIEQDDNIQLLVTESITTLLNNRPELEGAEDAEDDGLQSQEMQTEPASVAIMRSSPPTLPFSPSPQSYLDMASAHKRRTPNHTLEDDGFEFRKGVNLQGPVKAQRTRDGDILLKLLQKEQPRAEVVAETPTRPFDRSRVVRGHGLFAQAAIVGAHSVGGSSEHMGEVGIDGSQSVGGSPEYVNEDDSPDLLQTPRRSPPRSKTLHSVSPRSKASKLSPSRPNFSRVSPGHYSYPRVSDMAASPKVAKPPTQPKSTHSTQVKPHIPYGRRKIPANQRALLNQETSWLPSLPGCRFPKPNVPIELLTKWNAAPSASQKSNAASGHESVYPSPAVRPSHASQPKTASPKQDDDSLSESPTESSDDSDKIVSSSQWPPSPSQAHSQSRPDLPPDSSIGNVVRGTPEELEVEPPRPLKVPRSAQRAALRPQIPLRHPLPNRPPGPIPGSNHAMLKAEQRPATKSPPRRRPHLQESPRMQQQAQFSSQAYPPMQPSPREPNASDSSTTRHDPRRPTSPSSNRDVMLLGLHHTAPPSTSNISLGSNNARLSTPSRPSCSSGVNDKSYASQSVNQPSRGSQETQQAPVPPREYIRKSRTEWQAEQRKHEERLKAASINPVNETMREFASSYINIRPGGAFASDNTAPQPRRAPVDVLAWKI